MDSDQQARLQWFQEARYGLFVHYGMYSVIGHGEQIMARDVIPRAEYEPYAAQFNPPPGWAEHMCQQAVRGGMKYIVLTTRHHDGYCLFETKTHDFHAAKTGPGRDLVREYVEAARKAGLRVGFYYSVHSWRWRCFWDADSYAEELPRVREELHTQVRELMTNYGPVDILWYDVCAVPGQRSPNTWGGTPICSDAAYFWQSAKLNAVVRELQPGILINNRSGLPEDFSTPEQHVTPDGPERAFESCMTINNAPGWGYQRYCTDNKTAGEVLFNLVNAVRLGGNMLFNLGPRADGTIDRREAEVFDAVGAWVAKHGEAIYGTRPEGIYAKGGEGQGAMFHYGMWTCKGKTGYLTLFRYPGSELIVSRIQPPIVKAELLTTGQPLTCEPISNQRTRITGLPEAPPDPLAPVLKVEFADKPYSTAFTGAGWLDGNYGA